MASRQGSMAGDDPVRVIPRSATGPPALASEAGTRSPGMVAERADPDGVSIFMNIGTTTEAVARALLEAPKPDRHQQSPMWRTSRPPAQFRGDRRGRDPAAGRWRVGETWRVEAVQGRLRDHRLGGGRSGRVAARLRFPAGGPGRPALIKNAPRAFVADHTSSMAAPVGIASLAELNGFFTDTPLPKSVIQLCADNDASSIRTVENSARGR